MLYYTSIKFKLSRFIAVAIHIYEYKIAIVTVLSRVNTITNFCEM